MNMETHIVMFVRFLFLFVLCTPLLTLFVFLVLRARFKQQFRFQMTGKRMHERATFSKAIGFRSIDIYIQRYAFSLSPQYYDYYINMESKI